jgi:hypothetical protein
VHCLFPGTAPVSFRTWKLQRWEKGLSGLNRHLLQHPPHSRGLKTRQC